MNKFDVLVIGGGHAGIEAAAASARMGCKTAMVSADLESIGRLSCNPAIGGMAKGQLVREIDALGGQMGRLADLSGVQFKMLGLSKGPAMWSPRSQNDKDLYPLIAREQLESLPNLYLIADLVCDVVIEEGSVKGVMLESGGSILCSSIVLCAGTFLCGRLYRGQEVMLGGRIGENSAEDLSGSLRSVGFVTGRLKTGTPPRLYRKTIDFDSCEARSGDPYPQPFSRQSISVTNKIVCHSTSTNTETHKILKLGFDRSPMFTGRVTGSGPRYCPSVEDKIFRFSEKESHTITLEPESVEGNTIYVNGFSTSLPDDIQLLGLRSIKGLERCKVLRFGYAVEYDFFPPYQLKLNLESKKVKGLFFAGQVNGTSGYEEAAAQGLMAGINAALTVNRRDPFILDRSQAYIGVLIDDLVNLGTIEPYRMFTSRAEYRLLLRQDNAELRLSELAYELGLVSLKDVQQVREKREKTERGKVLLNSNKVPSTLDKENIKIWQWLKRTNCYIKDLIGHLEGGELYHILSDSWVSNQLEIMAKYGGYIDRQLQDIEAFRCEEAVLIPKSTNYQNIHSLSSEGREKLLAVRPDSLGQAARISGVSRADLAILRLYIK